MQFPPLSRAQRFTAIVATLTIHALVLGLALFLGSTASAPRPPSRPMPLVTMAVTSPEPPGTPPPAPPRLPGRIKQERPPQPAAPPSIAPVPTGSTSGGGCATLANVSAAINADLIATTGLQNAPPELRSISGAVVLWNSGWSEGARGPDEPLQPARQVIEATLREVDPACLDEQVAGPRLVAIPVGDHSMYAVLGSGTWSWAQMLLPDQPLPITATDSGLPMPPLSAGALPINGSSPSRTRSP